MACSARRLLLLLSLTIAFLSTLYSCHAKAATFETSEIAARVSSSSNSEDNHHPPQAKGNTKGGWTHLSTSLTLGRPETHAHPEHMVQGRLGHLAPYFQVDHERKAKPTASASSSSSTAVPAVGKGKQPATTPAQTKAATTPAKKKQAIDLNKKPAAPRKKKAATTPAEEGAPKKKGSGTNPYGAWWTRAGGKPNVPKGQGRTYEYRVQYYQKVKAAKAAKAAEAAKSGGHTDEHPSKHGGRPHSPGGGGGGGPGGHGHGPGGAAGGIAVRKRAGTPEQDHHASPTGSGSGGSRPPSPPKVDLSHLAHLAAPRPASEKPPPPPPKPRKPKRPKLDLNVAKRPPGRQKGSTNKPKVTDAASGSQPVAKRPRGRPLGFRPGKVTRAPQPKLEPWWNRVGGRPRHAVGDGRTHEYEKIRYQRKKAEKQKDAASLDEHPSLKHGDRPPSPGGGNGHGPGGAAGGVAVRKRASDGERHASPSGSGSGGSGSHSPPKVDLSHLAHLATPIPTSKKTPSKPRKPKLDLNVPKHPPGRQLGSKNQPKTTDVASGSQKQPKLKLDLNVAKRPRGRPLGFKPPPQARPKRGSWWNRAGGRPNRPHGSGADYEYQHLKYQRAKARKMLQKDASLDEHPSSKHGDRPPSPSGGGGGSGHSPGGAAGGVAVRKRGSSSDEERHDSPSHKKGGSGSHSPPQNVDLSHLAHLAAGPWPAKKKIPDLNLVPRPPGRPKGTTRKPQNTIDAASGSQRPAKLPVVKPPRLTPAKPLEAPQSTQLPAGQKGKKRVSWWNKAGGKPPAPMGMGPRYEYEVMRSHKKQAAKAAKRKQKDASLDEHPFKHGDRPPSPGGGGNGHGPGGAIGGIAVRKRASSSDGEHHSSPSGDSGGSKPPPPLKVDLSHLAHFARPKSASEKSASKPQKPKLDLNVAKRPRGRPVGWRKKTKTTDTASESQPPVAKRPRGRTPGVPQPGRVAWWNRAGGRPSAPTGTGSTHAYSQLRYQKAKAAKLSLAAQQKQDASLDEHPSTKHEGRPPSPSGGDNDGHGPGGAAGGVAVRKRGSSSDEERHPSPSGKKGGSGPYLPPQNVDLSHLAHLAARPPPAKQKIPDPPRPHVDLSHLAHLAARPWPAKKKIPDLNAVPRLPGRPKGARNKAKSEEAAASRSAAASGSGVGAKRPAGSPLTGAKPKKQWWNEPGGKPRRVQGFGPKSQYSKWLRQQEKASKQKDPSLDGHPSMHGGRPPSPNGGGGGHGHGPGGAAGGVAVRKRGSSSDEERHASPPGTSGASEAHSPSRVNLSHLAHLAAPHPIVKPKVPDLNFEARPSGRPKGARNKPKTIGSALGSESGAKRPAGSPLTGPKPKKQWWNEPGGRPRRAQGTGAYSKYAKWLKKEQQKAAKQKDTSLDAHPSTHGGRPPSPGDGGGGAADGVAVRKRTSSSSSSSHERRPTSPSSHGHGQSSGHGTQSPPKQANLDHQAHHQLHTSLQPSGQIPGHGRGRPAKALDLNVALTRGGRPSQKGKVPDLNAPAGNPGPKGRRWQSKNAQERARVDAALASRPPIGTAPLSRRPVGRPLGSKKVVPSLGVAGPTPALGPKKVGRPKGSVSKKPPKEAAGHPSFDHHPSNFGGRPPSPGGSGGGHGAGGAAGGVAVRKRGSSSSSGERQPTPSSPKGQDQASGSGAKSPPKQVSLVHLAHQIDPSIKKSDPVSIRRPGRPARKPKVIDLNVDLTPSGRPSQKKADSNPLRGPQGKHWQSKASQERARAAAASASHPLLGKVPISRPASWPAASKTAPSLTVAKPAGPPGPKKKGRPKATEAWWQRAGGQPNRPVGAGPRAAANRLIWQKGKEKKKQADRSVDEHPSKFSGRPSSPGGGNGHGGGGAAGGVAVRKRGSSSSSSERHPTSPSPHGHGGQASGSGAKSPPKQVDSAHLPQQVESSTKKSGKVPTRGRGRPKKAKPLELNVALTPSGNPSMRKKLPGAKIAVNPLRGPQGPHWKSKAAQLRAQKTYAQVAAMPKPDKFAIKRPVGRPPGRKTLSTIAVPQPISLSGHGTQAEANRPEHQKDKEQQQQQQKQANPSFDQHPSRFSGRPPSPGGGNGHGPGASGTGIHA